jgi:2-hydroxy-6-oxonona-2,4-dienedioate hydrolase
MPKKDVEAQIARITVPTQITYGRRDMLTDRFAERMHRTIHGSELVVFEECAHAPMYEKVEAFNRKTLVSLKRHAG